jgi:hypothetical protein
MLGAFLAADVTVLVVVGLEAAAATVGLLLPKDGLVNAAVPPAVNDAAEWPPEGGAAVVLVAVGFAGAVPVVFLGSGGGGGARR